VARVNILSIDGGGIRGLIPAVVLAEIERRTGRRVADLFGLIAGTSTGGILACALARPGDDGRPRFEAAELIELYEREGPEIFRHDPLKDVESVGGLADERYDDTALNDVLRRYLGDARLSQTLTEVLVTAYEIEQRRAFFFRSTRARTDPAEDFLLAAVARATSAAPSYFEPARVEDVGGTRSLALVDGGVFAINPSLCALAEVTKAGRRDELTIIASLGTGSHTRPLPYTEVRTWGALKWASPILDVVFDGVADTTDFELDQLLPENAYVRLQIDLTRASDDLDNATPANLAALRAEGEALISARSADLDALCATLTS
jgi:patatin-like phospholipase/acyl hydrolase